MFFGEIFLRILVVLFFTNKLVPEAMRSKKKVGFISHPFFYTVGSGAFLPPGSGMTNLGIRDKTSRVRNTGIMNDYEEICIKSIVAEIVDFCAALA
jgi:hypothetical protein